MMRDLSMKGREVEQLAAALEDGRAELAAAREVRGGPGARQSAFGSVSSRLFAGITILPAFCPLLGGHFDWTLHSLLEHPQTIVGRSWTP
jgi:hypothetical protein